MDIGERERGEGCRREKRRDIGERERRDVGKRRGGM